MIRDKRTGDSLQYAFIEFENQKDCEQAYFKMQGVLIDDHRIHVDFSQSVSQNQPFNLSISILTVSRCRNSRIRGAMRPTGSEPSVPADLEAFQDWKREAIIEAPAADPIIPAIKWFLTKTTFELGRKGIVIMPPVAHGRVVEVPDMGLIADEKGAPGTPLTAGMTVTRTVVEKKLPTMATIGEETGEMWLLQRS